MKQLFEDLKVWQKGMELVKQVYQVTQDFSRDEMFGMTSQIRRAAVSVPVNIAEGKGRYHTKEYVMKSLSPFTLDLSPVLLWAILFVVLFTSTTNAANITATLDEAAGSSVLAVNDSAAVEQCHVDSDGNAVFKGCLRPACLLVISAGRVDSGGSECTVSEGLVNDESFRAKEISGRVSLLYAGDGQYTARHLQKEEALVHLKSRSFRSSFPRMNKNTSNEKEAPQAYKAYSQENRQFFEEITGEANGQNSLPHVGNILGNKFPSSFIDNPHRGIDYHPPAALSKNISRFPMMFWGWVLFVLLVRWRLSRSYLNTSRNLSFPNALVGNLDDSIIRPPTTTNGSPRYEGKTFGGDSFEMNSSIKFAMTPLWVAMMILAAPAHAANITATLDEAAGSSVFAINDSAAVEQCHIDSDGNAVFKGCLRVDSGGAECTVTEGLVIDGNLGIGTTGPGAPLHVAGQCVTGDTRLRRRRRRKLPDGTEEDIFEDIRIDQIQPGDEIASLDEETGEIVYRRVNALMDMGVKEIYRLTTQSGKTIRTTGNHPYYVKKVSGRGTEFLYQGIFEMTMRVARRFYMTVLAKTTVRAPVLDNSEVYFSREGWAHLNDKKRSRLNLISRFMALPKVMPLLASNEAVIEYEKREDVEFWAFIGMVEGTKVKVVVRSIRRGQKHFYSVVWQGEEKQGKKDGAVSRLSPRYRGLVTPQLQEKYNSFVAQLSSLILKSSEKVFAVSEKDWEKFYPHCGGWIKVVDIREGDYIAAAGAHNKARFEKVIKIEQLPSEQVWDIEVEGTHNFLGNDIIAHNTFLAASSGNVGIGTTSPATKLHISDSALANIRLQDTETNGAAWDIVSDVIGITPVINFAQNAVADGQLMLSGGANAKLGIDVGGNVPVNTLSVNGNAAIGSGYYATAAPTDGMIIQGNVGIGTTGPGSKLDVTTAGLGTTQTTSSGLALVNTTAAAAGLQQISPAVRWSGLGWKTDATAASQAVDFRSYVVPVQGAANPTGYLSFGSSVNGAAYSDGQMVLTTAGNVGIGTTSPGTKLQVNGSISAGTNPATTGTLGLNNNGSIYWRNVANGADVRAITFTDSDHLSLYGEKVQINSNGNVGIGTTGPAEKLEVSAGAAQTALSLRNTDTSGNYDSQIKFFVNTDGGHYGAIGLDSSVLGYMKFSLSSTMDSSPLIILKPSEIDLNYYTLVTKPDASAGLINSVLSLYRQAGDGVGTGGGINFDLYNVSSAQTTYAYVGGAIETSGTAGSLILATRNAGSVGERVRITASGNVGIGTTGPVQKLQVAGDIRVGTGTTGCVEDADGTVIAGTCSSDLRLKKNVKPFTGILDKLVQLQTVKFQWRENEFPERHFGKEEQLGLIAQDVEKILPELASVDDKGYALLHYEKLPFYLLESIRELYALVKENPPAPPVPSLTNVEGRGAAGSFADECGGAGRRLP